MSVTPFRGELNRTPEKSASVDSQRRMQEVRDQILGVESVCEAEKLYRHEVRRPVYG